MNVEQSETSWRCMQDEALIACSGALVNAMQREVNLAGQASTELNRLSFNTR